jgi:hypothetical protein
MPTPVLMPNRCRWWAAVLGANLLLSAAVEAALGPRGPALDPNPDGSRDHSMGSHWMPCAEQPP